eukprot:13518929-Heterocapsa_arctica.AAC.1
MYPAICGQGRHHLRHYGLDEKTIAGLSGNALPLGICIEVLAQTVQFYRCITGRGKLNTQGAMHTAMINAQWSNPNNNGHNTTNYPLSRH